LATAAGGECKWACERERERERERETGPQPSPVGCRTPIPPSSYFRSLAPVRRLCRRIGGTSRTERRSELVGEHLGLFEARARVVQLLLQRVRLVDDLLRRAIEEALRRELLVDGGKILLDPLDLARDSRKLLVLGHEA